MLLVSEPVLGEEEKAALAAAIDDGWITMGQRVRRLETMFASEHDCSDAVAVSSCTAGLHLIVDALGIGPGDEVLVPSVTFVASANCVLYAGATPVFVDVESCEMPLMSVEDAARKITPRTKAAIIVHYAGHVGNAAAWQNFARERGIHLIEDAAHAAGTQGAGHFGDAAAFSFYGNKNMTTAEGGAVVAKDATLLAKIRQMRSHGMTSGTFQRFASRTVGYDVTMLGYNYRMDDLRAAVGIVQLERLRTWNEKRQALNQAYIEHLGRLCPEVTIPFADHSTRWNSRWSHHIMPVVLPRGVDRGSVIEALKVAGIQTTVHYPAVHRLSLYQERCPGVSLPTSEDFCDRELTLPLHPQLEEAQVRFVAEMLAQALDRNCAEAAE